MTDSVFDPRTGGWEDTVQEVRSCWTALLLNGFVEQSDLLPVFKARKTLDKLYCFLEKCDCDYNALVINTFKLDDTAGFWDNFAAIMVGVKTGVVVASGMVKDILIKCKLKAAMFLGKDFYTGVLDFNNLARCYGALLKASVENLEGQVFLASIDEQPYLRQLAEYYGDISSGLSVLDACCLAETGEQALTGISTVRREELLTWIGNYFSTHTDDELSGQFTRSLINEILGQQLCCKDFDALVHSTEEKIAVAESYGICVLDKKYLDYALGQVKNRL